MPANFVAGPGTDQQITRWSRNSPGGTLHLPLSKQEGSCTSAPKEQGIVHRAPPTALPPNVHCTGNALAPTVKEVTATGFNLKSTLKDKAEGVTWSATGFKAVKLPEGEKK